VNESQFPYAFDTRILEGRKESSLAARGAGHAADSAALRLEPGLPSIEEAKLSASNTRPQSISTKWRLRTGSRAALCALEDALTSLVRLDARRA
jgi:hypothetical protein